MKQKFEAHGSVELRRHGRILEVEGTGPWNLESLSQSGQQAIPLLDQLSGSPWAVMVVLHGECIYVHDAAKRLSNIIREEKSLGRMATAILVNDCHSPNFAKSHLSQIYTAGGETFEFFDDIDLARHWLTRQLN